jgi:hypothetical protein
MWRNYSDRLLRILCLIMLVSVFFVLVSIPMIYLAKAPANEDCIVVRVDGTVTKICQLIGDFDLERNQSTISLTHMRYGVAGTDLGVSFEHSGKLIFLFGDTVGRNAFPASGKDDSFAYTADENVDNGLNLTFYTGAPGKFLPPIVPGVSQSSFEVPMEGFEINGSAYVFFTTNHTEEKTMGSSIIARLNDENMTFTYLYTFSTDKFINVHVVQVENSLVHGLPETSGEGLLIWGSGDYRKSDPYLSYIPLDSIEKRSAIRYFIGVGADSEPEWGTNESDAEPLFHDPIIGELSVAWNPYLQRWIMLYDGVSMRSSALPWGNWSTKQVLFNPFSDGGYGHFIHWPSHDNISDPLRFSEWGGAYGPYLIDKFTKGSSETSTIYFTLSTWNPYTTVLMRADLKLSSLEQIPEWPDPFLMLVTGIGACLLSIKYKRLLRSSTNKEKQMPP